MSAAILTIGSKERGTLHWLMVRRLFILGQDPPALAAARGSATLRALRLLAGVHRARCLGR
jgi:hypothetical protein